MEDLRLAASKLLGARRRSFQAEMALKYCEGSARLAETVFGWGRNNVEFCLAEHRTGITCIGAQAACGGAKRWEERFPEVAVTLQQLAEIHAQQDPSFLTTLAYTRLTAKAASEQLRSLGCPDEQVPAPSTMALILNRMGYRLKPVVKAKPQKKIQKRMPSLITSKPKTSKQIISNA
ncbi:MAG: transposase [Gloeocapsa sp. UFS-A4-WI-NPMV-4B04]|nr:transposase [Gloeocapsa sp. UFS-A4-WI-NPMV-4B04]